MPHSSFLRSRGVILGCGDQYCGYYLCFFPIFEPHNHWQEHYRHMVFNFLIVSDEVDDFRREIAIDSEATFLDLQNAILDSVGYTRTELTSFFLCDEDWRKGQEITLMEMDTAADQDSYVMDETRLEEFIEDEHQRLVFEFDLMSERYFFIEVMDIVPGKSLAEPKLLTSEGQPPRQTSLDDLMDPTADPAKQAKGLDLGEDFFGDTEYNEDELDRDGFEGFDEITPDMADNY